MILVDKTISDSVANGDITISPFNQTQLGPNSYDVRLGDTLVTYRLMPGEVLDTKRSTMTDAQRIPEEGIVLIPGTLYLACTEEVCGSRLYVPMLEGRSSMARLGLSIHATAGFGDIGFIGRWTLEMSVLQPLRIYAGMRVGQVYFYTPTEKPANPYSGKYAGAESTQASRSFRDGDY